MKKILSILFLITFISCASGNRVMTADEYYQVEIGMSTKEVKQKFGKPYSKKNLGAGSIEYKYIERIIAGNRVLQERHYLIVFTNDKVSSKKIIELNRPVYERNSYEMQTSSTEKELTAPN